MQDVVVISPLAKKRALPTETRTAKKLTRKTRLQALQRRVYEMEGVLLKTKRTHTTLLPWEEIAQALKDDTLDQVKDNRCLKQQIEAQKQMNKLLSAWIHSMYPQQRYPSSSEETWRHSQLLKGDDACRRVAQSWIIQQAYHNTGRALGHLAFPDSLETSIDVDVTFDPAEDLFCVNSMAQVVLPYSKEHVVQAYWVAENMFTLYRYQSSPLSEAQLRAMIAQDMVYVCAESRDQVRCHALHGRVDETADRTTIVGRTILHDEAFPWGDATAWILDVKQWQDHSSTIVSSCCIRSVVEALGPQVTRIRTFYTIAHPRMASGTQVSMADLLAEFDVLPGGDLYQKLRAQMTRAHYRQRDKFLAHLNDVLRRLVR
ncbi:Aste57867_18460 [Aphanomyces stellatus]|uniref:Aste57867_18460 protein n=1 Tax=Aphanomyces stellatus TaxID=120398 RepID=A0A485LDW9_9STRA|nr:hypothetical protein As57867_018398 [Aphanomyces stellatus]VFT95196.1 Aste57867_18460 [Aphanomyces stellatus]